LINEKVAGDMIIRTADKSYIPDEIINKSNDSKSESKSNSILIVAIVVPVVVIAIAAIIIIICILKNKKKDIHEGINKYIHFLLLTHILIFIFL
jgi:type IV secretory pathway component VirB8